MEFKTNFDLGSEVTEETKIKIHCDIADAIRDILWNKHNMSINISYDSDNDNREFVAYGFEDWDGDDGGALIAAMEADAEENRKIDELMK